VKDKVIEQEGVKVKIEKLKLHTGQQNIIAEVEVSGDVNANFKVMGFPKFSPEKQKITIENLKIETDIKDAVINAVSDWLINDLVELLNGSISFQAATLKANAPDFAREKIQNSKMVEKVNVTLVDLDIKQLEIKLGK